MSKVKSNTTIPKALKYRELPEKYQGLLEFKKETHKLCTTCDTVQLRSHFTSDKSKPDGKRPKCKGCQRKHRESPAGKLARLTADRKYQKKPESRYKKYVRSAAERGYEFWLTFPQFMKFWQKPCTHCGDPIDTIGLDRVNSKKPYQMDNVEPCCRTCNAMKSDTDTLVWYKHMNKVINFIGE